MCDDQMTSTVTSVSPMVLDDPAFELPYLVIARQRLAAHRAIFTGTSSSSKSGDITTAAATAPTATTTTATTATIVRPFVTLTWAQSVDGSVTAERGTDPCTHHLICLRSSPHYHLWYDDRCTTGVEWFRQYAYDPLLACDACRYHRRSWYDRC